MSVVVHAVGHSRFSLGPSDFPNLSFRRVMWASEKSGVAAAVERDHAAVASVDVSHRFASSQPISPISPVTPLIVRPTLQYATVLAKGAWHDVVAVPADVEEELANINSGAADGVSVSPMPASLLSPDAEVDEEVAAATAASALSPSESEAGADADADGATVAAQALVEEPSRVPTPVAAIIDALPEPVAAEPEPVTAQPEPHTDAKSQPEGKTKSKKSKAKRPADAAVAEAAVAPLAVQVQEESISIAEPTANIAAVVPVAAAAAAVSPQSKATPTATPKPKKKKAVAAAPAAVIAPAPVEVEAEPELEPEPEIEEEAPAAPAAIVAPRTASLHLPLALFGAFVVVLIALSVVLPPARALLLPLAALLVVAVGAARHPEGRSKVPPAVMQLLDQCGLLETGAPPPSESVPAHTPRRSPKKGKHKSRR